MNVRIVPRNYPGRTFLWTADRVLVDTREGYIQLIYRATIVARLRPCDVAEILLDDEAQFPL